MPISKVREMNNNNDNIHIYIYLQSVYNLSIDLLNIFSVPKQIVDNFYYSSGLKCFPIPFLISFSIPFILTENVIFLNHNSISKFTYRYVHIMLERSKYVD